MPRSMLAALGAALLLSLPAPEAVAQPAPPGVQAPGAPAGQARRQPRAGTPTEQLFEAINEGEFEDVRAAVAAGADVGARNLLGLTPVDLAIDLGRNDVALYLLSLSRGRVGAPGTAAPAPEPPRRPPPAAPAAAAPRGPAPAVTGQGIVAVAPLWRGDGGAPIPEIGFLGFDAGRPPGAAPPRQR